MEIYELLCDISSMTDYCFH